MNTNSNQNKCFDITMYEENDIDEYIQDNNNNIVFIDKINKKAFCSNREDLKKFYLDSIVFPCTKTFANLFIVGHDNIHAATGEKIIETIPYVKLKNLAIGYDGVITLESFYNLVINSSQNKYNIEKPNKNEKQSLVATIDRNLVKKYMKIGSTPDAVSNAHCQVGTNVNILKIVDPSKPDYKDKEKDNFSIPLSEEEIAAQTEQEIRARTVVRSPTANERRNVRTITSNRRANRNNDNNNNRWHPYPGLRDIGHSTANTYQQSPAELTSQQIAFANNFFAQDFFGQNGQPNNNNNNIFVSQPQEDLFSIQNTPVQNSNSTNIPNAPVRDRLTPILNSVNQRNNNSNQPVRRSLFSQIPAAQQSVLTQSSTNNNSNNNTPNSPILGRRRRNNSNNNTSNTNNISTPSIGRTQTPENRNSRTRRIRPRTMGHGGKKKISKRKATKKKTTKRKITKKKIIKKRVTKRKT